MASIVAFQGVPYIANYAATKAYDLVLAESLAAELNSRLTVPGMMNKFLVTSGKYLQTRRMATYGFGQVFGRILRNKLR